jgi:hypothetical protein
MPAVGAFDTTVNHLYFASIDAAEANQWNRNHDANHQIQANTKLTVLTNSSIHQKARFTYNDSSHDQQFAVDIDLSSLSTPWVRQDSSYKSDPFLGCIAKQDCSPANPTHKGDAVIQMDITDNNFLLTKDLDYVYDQVQAQQVGLSEFESDNRLPAPTCQLSSVVNSQNHQVVYSSACNDNNNIYAQVGQPNRLLSSGGVDGIGLMPGQQYTLDVVEASTKQQTQPAESTPVYGGGFAAVYVGEEESGATTYLPIHSDGLKAILDSKHTVPPYFYSKFGCAYPNPVGKHCSLTLSIGGNTNGQRTNGMLYIADANSQTTAISVYLNARLVAEPFNFVLNQGNAGDYYLRIKNFGKEDYAQLTLTSFPPGTKIKSKTCNSELKSMQQCKYDLDLSQVPEGNYSMTITGLTAAMLKPGLAESQVPVADQESIKFNVFGSW